MKKRMVRCYVGYAIADGIYNDKVYHLVYEGWLYLVLTTCINCGELFVIDKENPQTAGRNIEQIAGSQHCPKCNSILKDTLKEYPQTFRTKDGRIGSFHPPSQISPDNKNVVIEFWEMRPESIS